MTNKIFRSIFAATMSVLLASLIIILGVFYSYFNVQQERQLNNMLEATSAGVTLSGMEYLNSIDENCRVTWIDKEGTVLFDSEKDIRNMKNHAERSEVRKALNEGSGRSTRYSETMMHKTMYRASRLPDGTVLRVSLKMASVWLMVLGMLQPIALVILLALILSIGLAYKLSSKIVKPLTSIDLEHPLDNPPYEEVRPLLKRIDAQNKELERQRNELADKRLSMEFAEANRREFTANVSHELKTPLQSIMGRAELLENSIVKPEDVPNFGGDIRKESKRLLALIDDIIHLSRLDEGSNIELQPIEVRRICEDEIDALRTEASKRGIEISLTGSELTIDGVPQLMREIIHNLIDNAVKYNRLDGKVVVSLEESDDMNAIRVSDNGIGVDEAEQDRIFERFYRVDKSHSKETGGTGLGLSIVKHATKYMNGRLEIESELGKGTTISVIFDK